MNCRRAQKWMSLDLDGELSSRRRTVLEAHVASCSSCQEARQLWQTVGSQFRKRELPVSQTAEAAWADVRRAIRNSETEKPNQEPSPAWGRRMAWATVAIAIAAVGMVAFLVSVKPRATEVAAIVEPGGTKVEWVETSLPGATSMVYEDEETGWVVIWVVEADREENDHAGS